MKRLVQHAAGYKRRLQHEWRMWRHRMSVRRKRSIVRSWLDALEKSPPDVLLGGNFAAFGGVRGHLHKIVEFSDHRIEITPPDRVLLSVTPGDLKNELFDLFLNYDARGVSVLHSHVYPWFIDWCQARQTSGSYWVHTHHNWYYPEFGDGNRLESWQEEFNQGFLKALRCADRRVSVARWQQRFLLDEFDIETEYVPNGVDVLACDKADPTRFRCLHSLERFVLFVGRDDPVKNPVAFVELAERLPDVRCVMIGDGLDEGWLTNQRCGEIPKNLLLLGKQSHQTVQDAIAACAVLVVTSRREGLPTLVLEAMVHESPVVVPDEDGCREAIGEGQFGDIYAPGNIDELSMKTTAAFERGRCDRGARRAVLQQYDWRVVVKQLDAIYRGRA